jgi:hypothetical protein
VSNPRPGRNHGFSAKAPPLGAKQLYKWCAEEWGRQRQLAKALQADNAYVNRWAAGTVLPPRRVWAKLSELTGIPVESWKQGEPVEEDEDD